MRPQIVKKILLLLFLHLWMFGYAFANEKGPPPPMRDGRPPTFTELPIDNHILILIMIGVLLGAYFLYRKENANL